MLEGFRVCQFLCPSVLSPVCLEVFLELNHRVFIKLWNFVRNPYEILCSRAGFFEKIFFASKMAQTGPKINIFF